MGVPPKTSLHARSHEVESRRALVKWDSPRAVLHQSAFASDEVGNDYSQACDRRCQLDIDRSKVELTVGFGTTLPFRIHSDAILRPAGPHKRPPHIHLPHRTVNQILQTFGTAQSSLRILGDIDHPVGNFHFDQAVRQVFVARVPILRSPAPETEDSLDQEHIGQGIADRLIDHFGESNEVLDGVRCVWRVGLGGLESGQGRRGKKDGAVAVGFKVDTDIEALRCVMQMFDASGDASYRNVALWTISWTHKDSPQRLTLFRYFVELPLA